jgi:hypothetical protein
MSFARSIFEAVHGPQKPEPGQGAALIAAPCTFFHVFVLDGVDRY